jgi:excisionase family DNA binding protein
MSEETLLKVEELATRIKVSRSTAYALVKSGEIKSIWVGTARRVPVAAVMEWLDAKLAEAK